MIYFRKNDEVIEKYQVDFDKEKLEKLRGKIIVNCSGIGCIEYKSDYLPNLYDELYDLVELISELLNGNSKVIDSLLINYDIFTKLTIDEEIKLLNQEFNKINPENIIKKEEKLKELEYLLKTKDIVLYYNQLIELIKFELVDSLSISEISRVEAFLKIELSNKLEIGDSKHKPIVKSLK